jgi:Meckel syndrome type 1 protein
VVGAAAASAVPPPATTTVVYVPPPPMATLPCAPVVTNVNGVTYYSCGHSYYVQAYGSSGPTYMPVEPPAN